MSESRLLRNRLESLAAGRTDESAAEAGSASILLRTKVESSHPNATDRYFACSPLEVDGSEQEGAPASFQVDSSRTIYAVCLGPGVPPAGTKVIGHDVGGRWVFQYGD